MKRWHQDYPIAYREWKRYHGCVEINCIAEIGRFRKKDAWDCGNSSCYICHNDKLPKRSITYQEWCADLKLKEGIEQIKGQK